jgi:myo-inositol 2-dehydrogenase/D-chiro-inositol 1-dehydrogenase/scyllo-inositol 2-dehydrogenase (NAD+)
MADKIRFVVVGCGRMGLRRMKRIDNHPEAELVGIADVDKELVRKIGNEFGVDHYSNYDELTNRSNVDCIVTSVPNKFHAPIAIGAVENGKHVSCEKPMARNPDEGIKIVEAAIENDTFLKIGSNLRYFPSVQKAKELLNNSKIGDILYIRGWIGNTGWQLNKSWFSDIELVGSGTFLDMDDKVGYKIQI